MLTFGKQIEGRHVGLDFYDLLIEALIDTQKGEEKADACAIAWFCQLTIELIPQCTARK
jgi:hypothetical protein